MGRTGTPPAYHAHHFLQLLHQVVLGMEPTGRIDQHNINSARFRRIDRIERDRRGVAFGAAGDAGDTEPVRPNLELVARSRTIRVCCGHQDRLPGTEQSVRDLRELGRLADAVHAHENHDGRPTGNVQVKRAAPVRELLRQHLRQPLAHGILRANLTTPELLFQRFHDVERGRSEIGLEQNPLDLVERVAVEALDEDRDVGERDALDPSPQSALHGSPRLVRHAHSPTSAAMTTTNTHHRSRAPTRKDRARPDPALDIAVTGPGWNSGEYDSTTATPDAPVRPGTRQRYVAGGRRRVAVPSSSNLSDPTNVESGPRISSSTSRAGRSPVHRNRIG